jgi:hypothetical protein
VTVAVGCQAGATVEAGHQAGVTVEVGCQAGVTVEVGCQAGVTVEVACQAGVTVEVGCQAGVTVEAGDQAGVTVEVRYHGGCPHAAAVLALVERCIAQLGLDVEPELREGAYPSPSVVVNGIDVMGAPSTVGAACRLELPSEERVIAALAEALS